jgi:hypothetical protein
MEGFGGESVFGGFKYELPLFAHPQPFIQLLFVLHRQYG